MVVEATVIVPGDEDGSGVPLRPLHHCIDLLNGPVLTVADGSRRVFAGRTCRYEPAYAGKLSILSIGNELSVERNMAVPERRVANLIDGIEGIPLVSWRRLSRRVIVPRDAGILQTVRYGQETETGIHFAQHTIGIHHIHEFRKRGVASP